MVTFEQAAEGTLAFVAEDVLPSMPNGPRKFAAYMALGALRRDPGAALKPYAPFLKMSGILSEDGTGVDEERLGDALGEAFGKMPSVDFLGFTFTEADAGLLVRRVANGG